MPEEPAAEPKRGKRPFFSYWSNRILTGILNIIADTKVGQRLGLGGLTQEAREEGKLEAFNVKEKFKDEFELNQGIVTETLNIERKWDALDKFVFPYKGEQKLKNLIYDDEPTSETLTDFYRKIEYFMDPHVAFAEWSIIKEGGTVRIKDTPRLFNNEERNKLMENYREAIRKSSETIKDLEEKEKKTKQEEDNLQDARRILKNAMEYLERFETGQSVPLILKEVEFDKVKLPFLDGREESVVAFGVSNINQIMSAFQQLSEEIDNFAAANLIPVGYRQNILKAITDGILPNLRAIQELEDKHASKLLSEEGKAGILSTWDSILDLANEKIKDLRPNPKFIRFAHTYKIIKPYKIVESEIDGKKVYDVKYFKNEHSNFNKSDEIEAGLDENGWPLEVYEEPEGSDNWFVLLDKWWLELSQNDWHEKTIKGKAGGKDIWKRKVEDGVKKHSIRKVPPEWVKNPNLAIDPEDKLGLGIGDVDPLDKVMFIYNEWDSYRDDFRDGRYHLHSKTSMDYIIAGTKPFMEYKIKGKTLISGQLGITPIEAITLPIDTNDQETRIKFRPIYYTKADTSDETKLGEVNPKGGRDKIEPSQIPNDERQVTRRYEMEIQDPANTRQTKVLKNQVRKPNPFNPAFDRVAVQIAKRGYLHWGRMYYYETLEGITKWSENPFPHVTSRGMAKYLIDLTIRNTFSFNEAREILRSGQQKWDYGVRHYEEPFITDPLGPGGVLAGVKKE